MSTINMQTIRYINLLDRASKVKTTKCFVYNNTIIFAVPRNMVSRAIGPDAINIRRMQDSLGKKIRVIRENEGDKDFERFISDVVSPVKFKNIEIIGNELIINSGNTQSKANLIGRNKRRLLELKQIVQDSLGFDLKVL